jgi:hypothetical protein
MYYNSNIRTAKTTTTIAHVEMVTTPSVAREDLPNPHHTCIVRAGCAYRGEAYTAENGRQCLPWLEYADAG